MVISMEKRRVRIADIAEELGVSTATVSNVIHGKTKKISDETVKRIQQLLEERQYIPSMAGILLAQNDSRIIGVVINDHEKYEGHTLEDGFISASVNALAKEVEQSGYFLMLKLAKDCEEIPRFASMWNMVGVIVIGFCGQDYQKIRARMHIPMVIYDGFLSEQGEFVNIEADHYAGGVEAGRYLKEKGHQRVLCISDNDICMDMLRFQGLQSVIPASKLMIIPHETDKRYPFYEEHLKEVLSYSAVFAVSDYYAIDMLQFLQVHGIQIPEEISIIGFDDIREAAHTNPPLTTIRQNHQVRAQTAIAMLQRQKEVSGFHEMIKLPVDLVERCTVRTVDSLHKNENISL